MNVFSKLSTRLALPGNRTTEPHLELGYSKCDNPDCRYRNSVQASKGRYNCKGFFQKPRPATGIESQPKSEWRHGAAGDVSNEYRSDDGSAPRERCHGTYHVSAEQAYYASRLLCATNSEHRRRADLRRDKAARNAAREARSRAVKLANEVEEELKRELVLRRKERMRTERERVDEEEGVPIQQPVKRLKREIRRLPMVIKTPILIVNASNSGGVPSSPSPTSPRPALRRPSVSDDNPPRPRPVGIIWDESSLTPQMSPAIPRTAPLSKAQYPIVSRPALKARNRSVSMSDVNDRSTGRTEVRGDARERESPFRLRRTVTYAQARWVSYKNGLVITHFGTLVPTTKVSIDPLLKSGRS